MLDDTGAVDGIEEISVSPVNKAGWLVSTRTDEDGTLVLVACTVLGNADD